MIAKLKGGANGSGFQAAEFRAELMLASFPIPEILQECCSNEEQFYISASIHQPSTTPRSAREAFRILLWDPLIRVSQAANVN